MATIIKGSVKTRDHNCYNELPPTDRSAFMHNRVYDQIYLPVGTVARCSCGILWVAQRYGYTYAEWQPATGWLKWKHRNQGWDEVKHEGH